MKLILLPLILATGLCPFAATAQTFGSIYDPQFDSMTVEGRLPLSNLVSDNPNSLNIPPDVLRALSVGALEIRGRIEFNRAARLLRIYQYVTPPSTPYPAAEAPALDNPALPLVFDLSIEYVRWYEYEASTVGPARRNVTIVGRRLGLLKGIQTLEDEFGVVQLAFDRDDPSRVRLLTVAFAGALTATSTTPAGRITLDPIRSAR